jgi:tetratricopeptide (TPR) repeat protein
MARVTTEGRNHGDHAPPTPDASRQRLHGPFRIAVGLVLLVLALFTLRDIASPDIGFHLEAGNHILDGNGWPQTDPFTYTVTDHAYIDTSWGYQVALALVERAFGAPGMILVHVALTLATFWLATLAARLVPGEVRVLVPLLLLGGLAAEPRFEVRPEMLSYALLALVLYLLHRRAEGLRAPLWILPPIFLVWTNAHSLFILGWVALACFVAGLWMKQRHVDLPLLGWSVASVAVGLVNPYGWKALAFPLVLATRMREANVFARSIGEFFSPLEYLRSDQLMFYFVPIVCFFGFALLVLLSVRTLWRQRRFWCVLLCLAFLPLALVMIRNVPPLAVACLPGAVWGLSLDRVLDVLALRGRLRGSVRHALLGGLLLVTVGLGLRVCTDAYYVSSRRLERFGLGWNALTQPIDAAAYAEQAGLPGRVLNHLNFGGWLMWALPDPVFIDGRLEVMGETFYEEYRRALDSPAGLEAAVQRHGIGWIVFPYRLTPDLLGGLSRHRGWRLVYVDQLAVIFVRSGGETEAFVHESVRRVERPAGPTVEFTSLPGLGRVARPGPVAGWFSGLARRQEYPTEAFNRGVFHYLRAEPARAAAAFAEAIRASGGRYYEIYNNLGSALSATGRLTEARACYRIYLDGLPFYRREPRLRTLDRLADIDAKLGS